MFLQLKCVFYTVDMRVVIRFKKLHQVQTVVHYIIYIDKKVHIVLNS